MPSRLLALAALLGTVALMLAACGGGGGDEGSEEESEANRATVACEGSAISDTGLPAGFPTVDGVTLTKSSDAGPSHVVDGFYEGELQDAYDGYKDGFEQAGYTVVFDEIEDHDSEISYEGDGRTGQVALREDCEEEGRLTVHITNRPE
jgi:hypothetical protein